MRRIAHTVAAALALLWPVAGAAQSGGALTAMTDRGSMLGWEAVGRLDLPGGFCTGVLIGSDLVLTAAHCVRDKTTDQDMAPESITFRAGYSNGRSIADRRVSRIATPADFSMRGGAQMSGDMIRHDIALLRLEQGLTSSEADPFRLHTDPRQGDRVSVVSYGRGREEVLSREADCAVTDRYRGGLMEFDCNVTFGSSGAPVFAREGTRSRIVSLISAGRNLGTGSSISYGMELAETVTMLKQELRYGAARPPVSTGAKRITVGQGGLSSGTSGAKFVRP